MYRVAGEDPGGAFTETILRMIHGQGICDLQLIASSSSCSFSRTSKSKFASICRQFAFRNVRRHTNPQRRNCKDETTTKTVTRPRTILEWVRLLGHHETRLRAGFAYRITDWVRKHGCPPQKSRYMHASRRIMGIVTKITQRQLTGTKYRMAHLEGTTYSDPTRLSRSTRKTYTYLSIKRQMQQVKS